MTRSRPRRIRLLPPPRRAAALLLAATLLLASLRLSGAMEQHLLYFPDPTLYATPATFGLDYEDVTLITSDNVRLHGWFVPGAPDHPVLLFLHGNAGNISHRLENIALLHKLGLSLFIFDYRGYGQSEGKPGEAGLDRDADAALAWLQQQGWTQERTVYFGRSLGAGVAVNLAARQPPAKLILETPFTSLREMGQEHYPLLNLLLGWTLRDRFDSLAKISNIEAPLLVLQGDRDRIVPEKMARKLFAAANAPKTFYLISGANHNNTYERGGERYWEVWREFLFGTAE